MPDADDAARPPLLERLDPFVGEWSIEASLGPGVMGRSVFEWVLGGRFLMERSEVPDVPEAPDGLSIVGVAGDGDAYTQHYFDSRGVVRVYAMTFTTASGRCCGTRPTSRRWTSGSGSPGSSAPTAAPSGAAGRSPTTVRPGSATST